MLIIDAIIVDAAKSADEFLDDHYTMVAAQGSPEKPGVFWDFNIGVAFFNLRHPLMGELLSRWITSVAWWQDYIGKASSTDYVTRKSRMPNDQSLLQHIVKWHAKGTQFVKVYRGSHTNAFNYQGGGYVEHILRATEMTPEERLENLKQQRDYFYKTYDNYVSYINTVKGERQSGHSSRKLATTVNDRSGQK